MKSDWNKIDEERLNEVGLELFKMTKAEGFDEVRIVKEQKIWQIGFFERGDLMAAHNIVKN